MAIGDKYIAVAVDGHASMLLLRIELCDGNVIQLWAQILGKENAIKTQLFLSYPHPPNRCSRCPSTSPLRHDEKGILRGTCFFFRAASRTKPDTVVTILGYQLAINVSEYQSFIEHRLAGIRSYWKIPRPSNFGNSSSSHLLLFNADIHGHPSP
jgi:hypothetical protein